ncbi:MAG: TIGR01212 family radical SAM protein [Prolixibacteraceae bacterium]
MAEEQFSWGHERYYNDYSSYSKKMFEGRVQKISVDGGFSCPNRDGSKALNGCSYCNNKTFNPQYCRLEKSISDQVREGIRFFSRKYPSMRYLAYFQAYSNTYAELSVLKERYREALAYPQIIGLVIGTRPDCVSNEILNYLAELSESCYVMIEFGLESVKDETLKRINRGHTFSDSVKALEETAKKNIHTCAHMILGLPGESYEDILNQARVISRLPVENLKLHQLQIHRGTRMAVEYLQRPDDFSLFTVDVYLDLVIDYLELLNPAIVIERFVSQAPADLVIAPKWGLKNHEFAARLDKRIRERKSWQGKLF